MIDKSFSSVIRLRKDTEANFNSIKNAFIPADGEVNLVVCSNGIRVKVGDGIKTFAQLEYIDTDLINKINDVIVRGYYLNDKFYTDSTYTQIIPGSVNKIYVDANSNVVYDYDGTGYHSVNDLLPTATENIAGVMKLYSSKGQNTDGTMTQKSITDVINTKFEVSISSEDEETIIFSIAN